MTEPKDRGEFEVLFQATETGTVEVDIGLAIELDAAMQSALGAFERQHGELVRSSCNVPISTTELGGVVVAGFLSHILARLESKIGRAETETFVRGILDRFESIRGDFVASSEAVQ